MKLISLRKSTPVLTSSIDVVFVLSIGHCLTNISNVWWLFMNTARLLISGTPESNFYWFCSWSRCLILVTGIGWSGRKSNYIHCFLWDIITHQFPNFNYAMFQCSFRTNLEIQRNTILWRFMQKYEIEEKDNNSLLCYMLHMPGVK